MSTITPSIYACHADTSIKVNHDLGESAFKLGEDYRDFRSLVDLCHATPPIYPPQENVHASRIQEFVDKYKEEFTNELYDWYMEHGTTIFIYESILGTSLSILSRTSLHLRAKRCAQRIPRRLLQAETSACDLMDPRFQ